MYGMYIYTQYIFIYTYVPYIYNKHSNAQQACLGDKAKQTFQTCR